MMSDSKIFASRLKVSAAGGGASGSFTYSAGLNLLS